MKNKFWKIVFGLVGTLVLCGIIRIGIWGYDIYDTKNNYKGIVDEKSYEIDANISNIKEGVPFAIKRAKEWREGLELEYIRVVFNTKEEMESKKGTIVYKFYESNVKSGLDSSAEVYLDMNNNCITRFESDYGDSKELLGGGNSLEVDKWKIDIGEAVDIFLNEMNKCGMLEYKADNIIIRCWQNSWEIALLSEVEVGRTEFLVEINPETKEILRVKE